MSSVVTKECYLCGKPKKIGCNKIEDRNHQKRNLIKTGRPHISNMEVEALTNGLCYDCIEKLFNVPKPGNEKLFGIRLGKCSCCDRPVWKKDIKLGGIFICSYCGGTEYC